MNYPVTVQIVPGLYLEGEIPEEFVELCFECERPLPEWPHTTMCYNCRAQDFLHD